VRQNGDAVPLAKSRLARLLYKAIVENNKGDGLSNVCLALTGKSGKSVDTRWLDAIINDEREVVWDFSVLRYLPGILKLTVEDGVLFFEKLAVIIPAAENKCRAIIDRCKTRISEQGEKMATAVEASRISRGNDKSISPSVNKSEDFEESSSTNLLLAWSEARDERLRRRKEFADFLERQCQGVGLSLKELSSYCCGYSEYLTKLENSFFLTFTLFEAVKIVEKLRLLRNRRNFAQFFRLGFLGEVFSNRAVQKLYFFFTGQQLDNGLKKNEILDFITREEVAMEERKKTEFFEQLESVTSMVVFGRLLKELRGHESQERMAQRVEVSVPTLLSLERGSVKNPRKETLQKIFSKLGFSEEDFGRIWEKIEQIKSGKLATMSPSPKASEGQEASGEPKAPSDASGKLLVAGSDISLSTKVVLRELFLNIGKKGLSGAPTMDQVEDSLTKAGLGQKNIATSEIRLAQLRELCGELCLDDGDKAIIIRLLGFAQKDYIITIVGGDSLLLEKILFGQIS